MLAVESMEEGYRNVPLDGVKEKVRLDHAKLVVEVRKLVSVVKSTTLTTKTTHLFKGKIRRGKKGQELLIKTQN